MFKRNSISNKVRTKRKYSYINKYLFLHNFAQDQLHCVTWPVSGQCGKSLHAWTCDALGNAQEGSDLNTPQLIRAPSSSLQSLMWRCRLHWDSLHSQIAQSCSLIQRDNLASASCAIHSSSVYVSVSLSRSKTRPACWRLSGPTEFSPPTAERSRAVFWAVAAELEELQKLMSLIGAVAERGVSMC